MQCKRGVTQHVVASENVLQLPRAAEAQDGEGVIAPGWAPREFAAIPTAVLDPLHGAAYAAVPALIGSGSHHAACCNSAIF